MIKANVYGTQYEPIYKDTLLWSGELECIPRVEDVIFLHDGWGGARVTRVYWELFYNQVEIYIDDRSGEWGKEAEKIGVVES